MNFSGVHVATITPFNAKHELDISCFKKHLQFLADAGVHGLVPCGTTGEAPTLSDGEWAEIVQTTVSFAKSKNLVTIAGCGSNSTNKSQLYTEQAKEMGADAALIVTPYYNKPTAAGLLKHYQAVAEVGLPVFIYNVPSRTNINLSVELTKTLLRNKNIVGIKEATSEFSKWVQLASEIDWTGKYLLTGEDGTFTTSLNTGAHGIISAAGNVIPQQLVTLFNRAAQNDWIAANRIQREIVGLVNALFTETNPAPAKKALSLMGKCLENVRLPLDTVTETTSRLLAAELKRLGIVS